MLITFVAVAVAPGSVAADEPGEVHAMVEAGTSHGAVLGTWERRQSYSLSLLRLGELGRGAGARLTLLPPPNVGGTWELSADAVLRWANEGPFYFKPMGGIAVAAPGALWPPRIRAGAEVGLSAIHRWIGIEAGLTAVYSFPPSRTFEGEWVVSAGVGILFGFGASSSAPVASRGDDRANERPSSSVNPVMGTVLGATPMGGFNTCEGSKATPQCLQAMSEMEGAASTGGTSPPANGATTQTAIPAEGATSSSSSASATAQSAVPRSPSLWASLATAVGAALGFKSDEERAWEVEHARLMRESERTLEELRRQAQEPASGPGASRETQPRTSAHVEQDEGKTKLGRIYVTYTKRNTRTNRYYVGRTSMVADLTKPFPPQAQAAVLARDANHHIDESDDPRDPAFLPADFETFDVGIAVNYENRYRDIAFFRIRGREQQLIDLYGGAQSDTGKPYRTENAVRAVAKNNPQGKLFHNAATARWGQLHPYTGY